MNRKNKNKNKEIKASHTSAKRKSPENISNTEQNKEELVPETTKKDVVNAQEAQEKNELLTEIPKAPKRQRNNKKKERTENTTLGKEISNENQDIQVSNENQDIHTEDGKTNMFLFNEENQISVNIVNEDENKLERNFQPVLPAARKKKNKNKNTTIMLNSTEKSVEKSKVFHSFDENTMKNEEKNDNLTTNTVEQDQSFEQENKQKKKKDKKNKAKNKFEATDDLLEEELNNDLENNLISETSLSVELVADDIVEKTDAHNNIQKNEKSNRKSLQEQEAEKNGIQTENIGEENVSNNQTDWKVGKHKKKNKKDKNSNVKQTSNLELVPQKNESISTSTSVSNSEMSSEKEGKDVEMDKFSVLSKNEPECILTDVEMLVISKKQQHRKDNLRSASKDFEIKNNAVTKNITCCEEISSQKAVLTVPFVIPDTPLVLSNDQLPLTVTLPTLNTEEKKLEVKSDIKSKVVQVNDDLEELKLSIEKSLAELTILEKEENTEELKSKDKGETSNTDKKLSNETKIGKEFPHEIEPVNFVENLRGLMLPVDNEWSIGKKGDTSIYLKADNDEQNLTNLQFHLLKTDDSINSIKNSIISATEENNIHLNKSNNIVNVIEQKMGNESNYQNKKQQKESNTLSVLQDVNTKLHHQPKEKARKKNKQKGGNNENTQGSENHNHQSSPSTDGITSNKNSNDFSDRNRFKQTENLKASKIITEKKIKSNENVIGNLTENQVLIKDTVLMEKKEGSIELDYEKIEKFENTLPSELDDFNKSFEIVASEIIDGRQLDGIEDNANNCNTLQERCSKSLKRDKKILESEKQSEQLDPLDSRPKNSLGLLDTTVSSNKTDFKKEKNKKQHKKQAVVKIKDSFDIEKTQRGSKESQTSIKPFDVSHVDEEFVYKYNFRKVFLPVNCHVCLKDLKEVRIPCSFCNLTFYCSPKHKEDDWIKHQSLCFAVSSVTNVKGAKFIYSDAKGVIGHNYRLLRMQAIISCEKILQRKLTPWEQEALLYPRICAEATCREWTQNNVKDCEGCGQIAYCKEKPEHLPKSHQRWCKSYNLYKKLVIHQQTIGKLEPKLPTRVIMDVKFCLPDKINELLATLYEEKIDIDDMQYAILTQLTTAPLTTAYCYQLYDTSMNSTTANGVVKKSTFTVHSIGAELQFEADALNKWEIFFLHLRPDVKELNVVLIGPNLNPSNLPLGVLSKIKLCQYCREDRRCVKFSFYDKKHYYEFYDSDDFNHPDIVCAFNPSIHRAFACNAKDSWTSTLRYIFKTRAPFCLTSYTPNELDRDLDSIRKCVKSEFKVITGPSLNPYASIRPDRNFISDDEMPLIFKNYYYMILSGPA